MFRARNFFGENPESDWRNRLSQVRLVFNECAPDFPDFSHAYTLLFTATNRQFEKLA
jgi:hypothetical protein